VPYDGGFKAADTALVIIDMQTDFCGIGGYVDKMGYDISLTRAPIAPLQTLLAQRVNTACTSFIPAKVIARSCGFAGQQTLALAAYRRRHCEAGPCGRILVRGEPGWEIIADHCALALTK